MAPSPLPLMIQYRCRVDARRLSDGETLPPFWVETTETETASEVAAKLLGVASGKAEFWQIKVEPPFVLDVGRDLTEGDIEEIARRWRELHGGDE